MERGTLVALHSNYIRLARTLSAHAVTGSRAVGRELGAEVVADTALTGPSLRIAVITDLAVLALESFRVVETLQAVTSLGIATLWHLELV